jgi:hypothetical protein
MPHNVVGQLKGEMRMDYTQGHNACQNMERMGGSFERQLALTYYRADSTNAQRLRNAFPEIFEKNLELYEFYDQQARDNLVSNALNQEAMKK